MWVLASETNLLGRTFANLRRILESDTVDVAVAAMDERDELAQRLEDATLKLDAMITDTERSGMLGRSAADKLRRGLVDTLGDPPKR